MSELLTPEKRAELRALIAKSELADDEAAIAHALLDAVDERDRMRRLCDAAISTIELKQGTEDDLREQVAKLREFVEATVCTCTSHPCRRCSLIAATAPKEATS